MIDSNDNDRKVITCRNCGNELSENDLFCNICGIRTDDIKKNKCKNCGEEYETGKIYCAKCGNMLHKTSIVPEVSKSKEANNTTKKVLIITSIVLISIIGIIGTMVANISAANRKAEAIKLEYIANTKEFLLLTADINEVNSAFLWDVGKYWYAGVSNRNEDKYHAIAKAMYDNKSQLEKMYSAIDKIDISYLKIKNIPDGINDDSLDDLNRYINKLYISCKNYYDFSNVIQNENNIESFSIKYTDLQKKLDNDYKVAYRNAIDIEYNINNK